MGLSVPCIYDFFLFPPHTNIDTAESVPLPELLAVTSKRRSILFMFWFSKYTENLFSVQVLLLKLLNESTAVLSSQNIWILN